MKRKRKKNIKEYTDLTHSQKEKEIEFLNKCDKLSKDMYEFFSKINKSWDEYKKMETK